MELTTAECPLSWVALRMTMHAVDATLPLGMGALWRSALGNALRRVDAQAFGDLYGAEHHGGRLFALRPPLQPVRPGQTFEWGVTLFGPAARHARAVVEAARVLGTLGIGRQEGRALLLRVVDAAGECWQFDTGWCRDPTGHDGEQWWRDVTPPEPHGPTAGGAPPAHQLVIDCLTPVAWKDHNQWATQTPTFTQWVRRILGRTAQLCEAACTANPIGHARARAYLRLSEHVCAIDARQCPLWLQRTSSRSGHTMRVPTQLGRFVYSGPVADFAPLLRWAEALQVGAKTAFGCGVIRWQLRDGSSPA